MLRDTQKRLSQYLLSTFIFSMALITIPLHADLSSLANNDALPMFTTLNLDDALLLTKRQLFYKDIDWAEKKGGHALLSISPFAQSADRGKTIKGQTTTIQTDESTTFDTALGDLTGRTGMIALLYGKRPAGVTYLPGGEGGALSNALKGLFDLEPEDTIDPETEEVKIDPAQLFGFFSFPLKYRKRGMRAELTGQFYNFGIRIQAGFSTIRQVRDNTIDLTTGKFEGFAEESVDFYLMDELNTIAEDMGYDLCDFIETSMDEVRFNLFWRQAFSINEDSDNSWARFLIIPYLQASGAISPSLKENGDKFFAAKFGNNGHSSAGFTAGLNFDFLETIEIGGEVGYTHFFKKDFCNMHIPNSKFQTNLFPFATNVSIQPGDSWHFGARLAAYHFIDRLSMYFEWFVLDHQQDHIHLIEPDPAFLPEVLECTTSFKTKLGNVAFNYDLSPNIGIGLLWQIPFSQRNSYRSSTIMAGLNVTF